MLTEHVKEEIRKHALENPNEEVCGFILNDNSVFRAHNVSTNKKKTFSIEPMDYLKAESNHKISAIYHSHISDNCEFSDFDKINAFNHNKIYILYSIKKNIFNFLYPDNYSNKYLRRKFDYETANCAALIVDFYRNELKIELKVPDIKINENWFKEKRNIILDTWKQLNPELSEVSDLKRYDIMFFNYLDDSKIPHHTGMYYEDGVFLHHPRHKLSRLEIYDEHFQKRTTHILRHKQLL